MLRLRRRTPGRVTSAISPRDGAKRRLHAGVAFRSMRKQYWQSWTFVLGKVDINYLTGELKVKRKKCFLGLQVQRAEQFPTTGRVGPKSHRGHRILLGGFKLQRGSLDDVWIMLFYKPTQPDSICNLSGPVPRKVALCRYSSCLPTER